MSYIDEILERVRAKLPRKCKNCCHEDTLFANKLLAGDGWNISVFCFNCRQELRKKVDNIKVW